ncbi:uncharacterized protein LOC135492963 [Lineus longissimus]|uniref:uncharacterized protein LOC135492963 n=1 Tax=Lineus longissimus TaxID=88925 RepID=UPI00315DA0FC
MYVREIFARRWEQGDFNNLVREMELGDHTYFFKYLRLTPPLLEELLQLVGPSLQHHHTNRTPIDPKQRLVLTLRYLASGDSQQSIAFAYRMGLSTVCIIVWETCNAIWTVLGGRFVAAPSTDKWKEIASDFFRFWNFPNCVGSIDRKHVVMQAPVNAGSAFYNYEGTHSIVLMAVCDAKYKFTLFDVGAPGRNSDRGVLANSAFGKVLEHGEMNFPLQAYIPGTNREVPHMLVGDEAFPLRTDLMRPFPGRNLPQDQLIFNYRLSRARRIIENAFGILAARWRIFRKPIISKPEHVVGIVKATLCLHNFLQETDRAKQPAAQYCPPGFVDQQDEQHNITEGVWRKEVGEGSALYPIGRVGANNYDINAAEVRNNLKDYFTSEEGALPWQLNHVQRGSQPD